MDINMIFPALGFLIAEQSLRQTRESTKNVMKTIAYNNSKEADAVSNYSNEEISGKPLAALANMPSHFRRE